MSPDRRVGSGSAAGSASATDRASVPAWDPVSAWHRVSGPASATDPGSAWDLVSASGRRRGGRRRRGRRRVSASASESAWGRRRRGRRRRGRRGRRALASASGSASGVGVGVGVGVGCRRRGRGRRRRGRRFGGRRRRRIRSGRRRRFGRRRRVDSGVGVGVGSGVGVGRGIRRRRHDTPDGVVRVVELGIVPRLRALVPRPAKRGTDQVGPAVGRDVADGALAVRSRHAVQIAAAARVVGIIRAAQPPHLDARAAGVRLAVLVVHGGGEDNGATRADVGRIGLDVEERGLGVRIGRDGVHRQGRRQQRHDGPQERRQGDSPPAAPSRQLVHPRTPRVSHRKPNAGLTTLSGAPPPVGAGQGIRRWPGPLHCSLVASVTMCARAPRRGIGAPPAEYQAGGGTDGRNIECRTTANRSGPSESDPLSQRCQRRREADRVRGRSSTTARPRVAGARPPRRACHCGARRHRGCDPMMARPTPGWRYAAKTSCGSPTSIGLLTGSALHSNQPPS